MENIKAGMLVLLWPVTFQSWSQSMRGDVAKGYTGMGAYSINHADILSCTSNIAALAQLKNPSAAFYGERRFLISELSNYLAVLGIPTSSGNFGIKTNFSGFSDFTEIKIGLAYGRRLGNKIDIGAQFNYQGIRIAGYDNASAVSFEAGTILHITEQLHAGIHVINPVGGRFGKIYSEKLPSVFSFGMGFDASEKFLVSTEIEKEENQPVNVIAGMQYKFLPQLRAGIGMTSAASTVWISFGLTLKSFRFDITAGYHPQLGVTPGLLLLFEWNKSVK